MKTIETYYLGPTDTKGSRIVASDGDKRIVISRNTGDDIEDSYCDAAAQLKKKLNWKGKMYGGHTKRGMVFVFADERYVIE